MFNVKSSNLIKTPRWLLLIVLLVALTALGCDALSPAAEPAPVEPEPEAAVDTAVETAEEPETVAEEPVAAEVADESGDEATAEAAQPEGELVAAVDIETSLAELDSYRAFTTVQFGGDDESPNYLSVAYYVSKAETASRTEIDFSGLDVMPLTGPLTVAQHGERSYTVLPGVGCIASSLADVSDIDTAFANLTQPHYLVGEQLHNVRRVMPDEVVNGVLSRHYLFDEVSVHHSPSFHFTSAQGHLYIAQDGDYLVRLTMTAEGGAEFLPPQGQREGSLSITYDVLDVNRPVDAAPPTECGVMAAPGGDAATDQAAEEGTEVTEAETATAVPTQPAESETPQATATPAPAAPTSAYPRLDDAFNIAFSGGAETYSTNYGYDEVVTFYREEMAAGGWSVLNEISTPGTIIIDFARTGENVRVTITVDHAYGYVTVVIGRV